MNIKVKDELKNGKGRYFSNADIFESPSKYYRMRTECNLEIIDKNWMQGDASERSYQRIITRDKSYVIMNHNQKKTKENPTKLAENFEAFILINYHLESLGIKVPKIFEVDTKNSFLLFWLAFLRRR